jgi:hypothetical protein
MHDDMNRPLMVLTNIGSEGGGVDSGDSIYGPVAGCCEQGDGPSGSGARELVEAHMTTVHWVTLT